MVTRDAHNVKQRIRTPFLLPFMTAKKFIIPIHSVVDLITNSSSELFVTSDHNTIDAVKNMVDAVLKVGGSDKTFDDLFYATLAVHDGGYGEYNVVEVYAKDSENAQAAQLITKLNESFTAEQIGND